MATLAQIRTGIATAAGAVAGLNAHDIVPDAVNAPAAVVYGPEIDYDSTMARGSDDYRFWLIVLVSRTNERTGQEELDSYISPSGTKSLKVAIEADPSLGGVVDFVRVKSVREYGEHEANGLQFFGAAIEIEVTARP